MSFDLQRSRAGAQIARSFKQKSEGKWCARPDCFTSFAPRRRGQVFCSYECGRFSRCGRTFVELTEAETELVEEMLCELATTKLEVVLIPSSAADCAMRGGCRRAVQTANPVWYQKFCARYMHVKPRRHKLQTFISRKCTLRALARLLEGDVTSTYATRLLDFIRSREGLRV